MKNFIYIFLLVSILSGQTKEFKFDLTEKCLFGSYLTLTIGDVISTDQLLKNGGYETNPLIGKRPSLSKMILIKAVSVPFFYYITKKIENRPARKIVLISANLILSYFVINNIKINK